jgi:putative flippase GtrA
VNVVPTTRWSHRRPSFACVASRAAKFLAVGLVNSAVAFGTIAISIEVLGQGDFAANLLGYAFGLVTGFALNRRWTFTSARRFPAAQLQYVAAFAFSYALNICLVLGARACGLDRLAAQALGIPVYTASFFLLCHYVVFRDVRRTP